MDSHTFSFSSEELSILIDALEYDISDDEQRDFEEDAVKLNLLHRLQDHIY